MSEHHKHVIVGIDPGVKCGLATVSRGIYAVQTLNIEILMATIQFTKPVILAVYLEWPQHNPKIFRARSGEANGISARKGRDVGINVGIAYTIHAFCNLHGIPVIKVPPVGRSKQETSFLRDCLGIKASQHAADALWLVYERTPAKVNYDLQLQAARETGSRTGRD